MPTPHTVNHVTPAPTQATDPSIVLSLSDITFSYSNNTNILRDISLDFPSGSWSAIMGPSGSGKSTLLYCASGLLSPQHGHVICGTTDITTLKGNDLTTFRREHFGFVFQITIYSRNSPPPRTSCFPACLDHTRYLSRTPVVRSRM